VTASTRPLLRWHGGKWRLAPWIIGHFPQHRVYVEPYGGAASVLIRKPRAHGEVWNDLDDGVFNLMRALRDGRGADLAEMLAATPFARREFELAYQPADDPLESARRLVVRSFMGFGSDAHNPKVRTGFRSNSMRSNTIPATEWLNYPEALTRIAARIMGVVIEHRPALAVMAQHDSADTLHYVDPPYLPETRSQKTRRSGGQYHAYAHEMTVACHVEMLASLRVLKGMVLLSGYPAKLYDEALAGWGRVERAALADGARKRIEVLWLNPAAMERLGEGQLFQVAA
jgi:DNA adenine methylase